MTVSRPVAHRDVDPVARLPLSTVDATSVFTVMI